MQGQRSGNLIGGFQGDAMLYKADVTQNDFYRRFSSQRWLGEKLSRVTNSSQRILALGKRCEFLIPIQKPRNANNIMAAMLFSYLH